MNILKDIERVLPRLLDQVDLSQVTSRIIRRRLEENMKFEKGTLDPHKHDIRAAVVRYLSSTICQENEEPTSKDNNNGVVLTEQGSVKKTTLEKTVVPALEKVYTAAILDTTDADMIAQIANAQSSQNGNHEDQSADDQSPGDHSSGDQSAEDQSAAEQSADDQSAEEQSAEEQSAKVMKIKVKKNIKKKVPSNRTLQAFRSLCQAAGLLNPRVYSLLKQAETSSGQEEVYRGILELGKISFEGPVPTKTDMKQAEREKAKRQALDGLDTECIVETKRRRRNEPELIVPLHDSSSDDQESEDDHSDASSTNYQSDVPSESDEAEF